MNFKKLKRLLSVMLSVTMVLSTNVTGFAAEATTPDQADPAATEIVQDTQAHEHNWQLTSKKEATADAEGLEKWTCAGCGETKYNAIEKKSALDGANADSSTASGIQNPANSAISSAPNEENTTLTAEGDPVSPCETHPDEQVTRVSRKAPTCWSEGTNAYYVCGVCQTKSATKDFKNILTDDQIKIAKLDHDAITVPAVEKTCTQDGHREYFYCNNCSRVYDTIEAFKSEKATQEEGTKGTDWYDVAYFNDPALGHSFGEAQFNWDSFQEEGFEYVEGDANDVIATRTCTNDFCDTTDATRVQTAKTVQVTAASDPDPIICTVGGKITYTATAYFEGLSTPATGTFEVDVPEKDHTFTTEVDWDALTASINADSQLVFQFDQVTAKRVCNDCGTEENTQSVTITAPQDGDYTNVTCGEGTDIEFTAAVTFTNGQDTKEEIVKETINVKRSVHSLTYVPADDPDCGTGKNGNYAHYHCTACEKNFWDEDDAENGKAIENDAQSIAFNHVFGLPSFSFMDVPADKAKAVFTCTKCLHTVTIENLEPGEAAFAGGSMPACGQEATMEYPEVRVSFDKAFTTTQGETITYNPPEPDDPDYGTFNPIEYGPDETRKLTKQTTLEHSFGIKSAAWTGNSGAGESVTVVLACQRTQNSCSTEITLSGTADTAAEDGTVTKGTFAPTTGGQEGDTASLTLTKDDETSKPVTCLEDGEDVYDVAVTYNGKSYTTETQLTHTITTLGHTYVVDEPINAEVDAADPENMSVKTLSAKVSCSKCDLEQASYTLDSPVSDTDSTKAITVTPVTTEDDTTNYKAVTCTTDGKNVWTVSIAPAGGVPATKYADGSLVVVEQDVPAPGHIFDETGDPDSWDWSEYGEEGADGNFVFKNDLENAKVYARYNCTAEKCDHKAPDNADYEGEEDAAAGKWVKKVAAEVEVTSNATCGAAGTVTYTAKVGEGGTGKEDTKTKASEALGHDWGAIKWNGWTLVTDEEGNPVMKEVKVTVNGTEKTVEIPAYTITAERTCQRDGCNEKESFGTDESAADGRYIKITEQTQAVTCTTAGSTIYRAELILKPATETEAAEKVECDEVHVEIERATGHNYQVTWAWKGMVPGSETSVLVTPENEAGVLKYTEAVPKKECTKCKKAITVKTDSVTFDGNDDNGISCTSPDVFTYHASAVFVDFPDETYTDTKIITRKATGHVYTWTFEDWVESGEEGAKTYTATAVGTCQNNSDASHEARYPNVSVSIVGDYQHTPATCTQKETTSATGTFTVDGKTYTGTYTHEGAIDSNAHSYAPAVVQGDYKDWTLIKEEGSVRTYEVKAIHTCTNTADGEPKHTKELTGTVSIDFGNINCKAGYELTYRFNFGEDVADSAIKDGLTQTKTIPAGDHDLVRMPAHPGSCNEAGWKAYYHCRVCGNNYKSTTADSPVEIETEEPLGHLYGEPEFEWVEEGKTVRAMLTCTRQGCTANTDGHIKYLDAELVPGKPYREGEVQCVGMEETATDYYMVRITIDDGSEGGKLYEGDLPVSVPNGDHVFKEDGTCEFCGIAGVKKVSFVNQNGTEIASGWYQKSDDIVIPTVPSRPGYTFKGWSLNNGESTVDDVNKALADAFAAAEAITVTAVYEPIQESGSVTVKYRSGSETLSYARPEDGDIFNGLVGKNVTVNAEEQITIEGGVKYTFSHWANEDGVKLSTNTSYDIYIASKTPMEVYAVYVIDGGIPEQAVPVVSMAAPYVFAAEDGTNKMAITTSMSVPDGYTVEESGIIYSVSQALNELQASELKELMVLNSTDSTVKKSALNGTKTNVFAMKIPAANQDKTIHARGYMICRKNGEAESKVYYSDTVISKSYDDLNQ